MAKKFKKVVVNKRTGTKRTISYGQKGSRIMPGTDKGVAYPVGGWRIGEKSIGYNTLGAMP